MHGRFVLVGVYRVLGRYVGVRVRFFQRPDPALLIMGTDYEGVLCDEKGTGVAGTGSGNVIDNSGLKTRYWANFLEVAAVARSAAVAATTPSFASSSYTLADAKSMSFLLARSRPKRLDK